MLSPNGPRHDMNSGKVIQEQTKYMKSTRLIASGDGSGCVWFARANNHSVKGEELKTFVTNSDREWTDPAELTFPIRFT